MLPLKLSKEFSSEKVRKKKRESKLTTTIEEKREKEKRRVSVRRARSQT